MMVGIVKVKPLTLVCAVMIIFTLALTWNRLDSLGQHTELSLQEDLIQEESMMFADSEIDPPSWPTQLFENEPNLQQKSIFPPFFSFNQESTFQPVTAIVNRVDENEKGVLAVVKHLSKYPFIKEIFIYNQFITKPLLITQEFPQDIEIQIIDTDLQSIGKYTACAAASYNKCYFQDDLWLNPYMDSLYTHSLRYPEHTVANTKQSNYVDYVNWRFTQPDIDLHTGFTDLRYGTFIPKETVMSFIDQLNTQNFNITTMKQADVYFSIWTNQYPYLIVNPLLSSGRDSFKGIDTVNNRELVQSTMYDAVNILEKSLTQRSQIKIEDEELKSGDFKRSVLSPSIAERDVRTSCVNDKCLFITNMDPLYSKEEVYFDSSQISNISDYELISGEHRESLKATLMYQSFHKAVDQDTETCWNTIIAPKSGDYFGLYMIGDIQAKRVILYVKSQPDRPVEKLFKVSVQYVMYGSWETCTIKAIPARQTDYRLDFDFKCQDSQPLKSIRIEFIEDQEESFELCGLGLDNFVV